MKKAYYDCHDCNAEEILEFMMELFPFLRDRANRKRVYVGATGNVAARLQWHNVSDGEYLFSARTAHRGVAARVERLAHEKGFCIGNVSWGGNGTNSSSVYVYAYIITDSTIE